MRRSRRNVADFWAPGIGRRDRAQRRRFPGAQGQRHIVEQGRILALQHQVVGRYAGHVRSLRASNRMKNGPPATAVAAQGAFSRRQSRAGNRVGQRDDDRADERPEAGNGGPTPAGDGRRQSHEGDQATEGHGSGHHDRTGKHGNGDEAIDVQAEGSGHRLAEAQDIESPRSIVRPRQTIAMTASGRLHAAEHPAQHVLAPVFVVRQTSMKNERSAPRMAGHGHAGRRHPRSMAPETREICR